MQVLYITSDSGDTLYWDGERRGWGNFDNATKFPDDTFSNNKSTMVNAEGVKTFSNYIFTECAHIVSEDKLNDKEIILELENGATTIIPVIELRSRGVAIDDAIVATKKFLKRDDAYGSLDSLRSASRLEVMRNYELEDYLDYITGLRGHKINDDCPYNGFSWFDYKSEK